MYLWTRDRRFLTKASEIGRAIAPDAQGWGSADPIMPGIAEGASGIALFLLYLAVICEDEKMMTAAKSALEFDIRLAGRDYRDGLPRWAMHSKDRVWSPYWLQGGCGIGSVLVRFHAVLGERRYLSLARDVARANYSRFSVLPGQFEGLSGIGEFMFDMSVATGEREFEEKAAKIVDSIFLYAVPSVTGLAFPGRALARKSNDFGYGSSGIGLFLDRVLHRKNRLLHDLEGLHR
jgi:lantibiotic modifying enzyme